MIEQFWPVGEPAANLRATMIGKMITAAIAGGEQKGIKEIWQMLSGTYRPQLDKKEIDYRAEKQRIKAIFNARS